jgi:hypothetical protein
VVFFGVVVPAKGKVPVETPMSLRITNAALAHDAKGEKSTLEITSDVYNPQK